jgi:hypothetical protein
MKNIERIIFIAIVVSLVGSIFWVINRYENDLMKRPFMVEDGVKFKNYTTKEIVEMIKKLPDYQGDSIIVFEDGRIKSFLPQLDGGLQQIFNNSEQLQFFRQNALESNLPLGFVVYRHVMPYYILEHKKGKK